MILTTRLALALALLVCCAVVATGCGKDDSNSSGDKTTSAQAKAMTPEEELRAALDGLARNFDDADMVSAMAIVDGPDPIKRLMIAMGKVVKAAKPFRARLATAYGEKEAIAFDELFVDADEFNFDETADSIRKAAIAMDGPDKAKIAVPGEKHFSTAKKVGDTWRLSMSQDDLEQTRGMSAQVLETTIDDLERIAGAMTQLEPEIGKGTLKEFMRKLRMARWSSR